jgi:hypothetical protein
MTEKATSFSFHIEPNQADSHAVPVSVLVPILANAQKAFELLGVQIEGREIRERARVSSTTAKRFQLVCHIPKTGSYVMPMTVGDGIDLLAQEAAEKATTLFTNVMKAISSHDVTSLFSDLPDPRVRRRVLEAVKGMAPRADAGWKLDIHDSKETVFATLDSNTVPFVEKTLVPQDDREASRIVTGELTSIDFTARKVSIIYPPTSKLLECLYQESVEDFLYEKRRNLIQVTGRVLLDDQGSPSKIIDVTNIQDLDLSPLSVQGFKCGDHFFKSISPIELAIEIDETKQYLSVVHSELGIDVFASTRDALLTELQDQLSMLWSEYVMVNDDELDQPARHMKEALLAHFAEVNHAA